MKVVAIATTMRRAGGTYVARRLFGRIGARIVAADQPLARMLRQLSADGADVHHIEFEYRTFGGSGRSLVILPLLTALLRARGPVVVTLHGLVTLAALRNRRLRTLILLAFRLSFGATAAFASAFVVHSEEMRRVAMADYGMRVVEVIPHGSESRSPAEGRGSAAGHVVFFGFVRPEKGLRELVDAVRQLKDEIPELRLTVAGSVPFRDEMDYLAKVRVEVGREGLGPRVQFITKFLSEDEVSALMRDASAVVLPYTDRFVEVSGVVHDLAGYGVPLVCTDIPRFSELEDGVDCLKVEPQPAELASAIRRILRDPALAKQLGDRLRQRSLAESWDVVAARHQGLYERLLEASP